MTGMRLTSAALVCLILVADLRAQLLVAPPPVVVVPGFGHRSVRIGVGGYFGGFYPAPFGFVRNTVSVQVIQPTVVVTRRRITAVEEIDLSGVDLDRVPASAIWGDGPRREQARAEMARPREPEIVKLPARMEPPAKKEVVAKVEPKKREVIELPGRREAPAKKDGVAKIEPKKEPPPRKVEPAPKPPEEDLWTPRTNPSDEARRLLELGLRAFRADDYGIASLRFRQATEVDPTYNRAFILLAQAELALGNYHEGVLALQAALRLKPEFPATDFHPRVELYGGRDEAWQQHRQRLLETHKRHPRNADYLLLLGFVDWFGDRRVDSLTWFRQARPLLPDPRPADLFLKSAAAPAS
jgi:hypothetical protein